MIYNYWTDSKFAKKILVKCGIPTPVANSFQGWKEYHEKWDNTLVMKVFGIIDGFQEFVYMPYKLLNKLRCYIKNRYVHKLHVLTTGLEPGKYYEFEERILFALFTEFINFIEIQKSFADHKFFSFFDEGRDAKSALEHLKWEINECDNVRQSEEAKWELSAYNWWKYERPARMPADEASGLNAFLLQNQDDETIFSHKVPPEIYKKMDEIEEQYYEEDTKWLKELIERRRNFWT